MKKLLTCANIAFALLCAVTLGALFTIPDAMAASSPHSGGLSHLGLMGLAFAGITMDVFNTDIFKMTSLTELLRKVPFLPQTIASKNIFTPKPIRTEEFWIEEDYGHLTLIGATPRGAPAPQATRDKRKARNFTTIRIAKDDSLRASELAFVRATGSETELMQYLAEVLKRQEKLRQDYLYTREYHLLAALQGLMLDADGSVIYNWFTEFGITPPADITIDISNIEASLGSFRAIGNALRRSMRRASNGALPANFRIGALCGDAAYDSIIKLTEVRTTYLNWQAAQELREGVPDSFRFGGVEWENYVGSDDNSEIAIPTDEIKFYPIGVPGIFETVMAPGEKFADLGAMGQEYYADVVPDVKYDEHVELRFRAYQTNICTRPETLFTGVVQA